MTERTRSIYAQGRSHSGAAFPFALIAILALTAAVILGWGHFKLLDQDEMFVLQTDSVPSLRALVDVQLHYPISLDPLLYHLLGHAGTRIFGATAFAVRLPSLLGYLLMQVCLFFLVRRIAGERAGIVAAAIPALTATLYYGVEARPYGLLLGLAALLFLAWQRSTEVSHPHADPEPRTGWLLLLGVALALALNTHYFAILLLIPLCAAELFRIIDNRRIDWPVALAVTLGTAGFAFALPFQKGANEFRKHYYNAGRVSLHAVTQAYRALIIAYTDYPMWLQHVLMAVLVLATVALLITVASSILNDRELNLPSSEAIFVLLLAALPFFGFLLARFVTHSIEVRYVLCAVIGLATLIAIAAMPLLRTHRTYRAVLTLLLMGICVSGLQRVREEKLKSERHLAFITLPDSLRARLLADPAARLYIQNMGDFDEFGAYVSDPLLRGRLALVYSRDQELRWLRHDTVSLTAEHMTHFTAFPVVTWEQLKNAPGPHLLLLYHGGGWNWTDQALAEDHATLAPVATTLQGEVVAAEFPSTEQTAVLTPKP
jgi:hypothetical protein